jgi:glutamine synthetase
VDDSASPAKIGLSARVTADPAGHNGRAAAHDRTRRPHLAPNIGRTLESMSTSARNPRLLTTDALLALIDSGEVDTVIVAFTDMQGRLQGKRLHAEFFRDHVLGHGTEGCNYLLAVDVEMNTVPGYAITSWESGYGDMAFQPDLSTIRRLVHLPATVMIQCDLTFMDGTPVRPSPRAVLAEQISRAAERGWMALAGTELEFMLFDTSYEEAWNRGYTAMVPANQYNVDYSILGTTRVEPLLREIRNTMHAAGTTVEAAKGECNFGQHEITFLYTDALTTADNHSVYKNVAKEIAAQRGKSITFMAKYDQREGSSCHIHLSLRGADSDLVFWDSEAGRRSALYDQFIAGVLATMADFTLLYAPNINSYKRFADGSFAPTTIGWGNDNRTCAVRLVGQGASARLENRVPGGDVNPYLAIAAMLAGGLYGIEHGLELEPELVGNAYTSGHPQVPRTLRDARDAFAGSSVARAAFGDDVVEHYVHAADTELAAFGAAVTDWERRRGFERL